MQEIDLVVAASPPPLPATEKVPKSSPRSSDQPPCSIVIAGGVDGQSLTCGMGNIDSETFLSFIAI